MRVWGFVCLLALSLAACGPVAEGPTPLPTAVPPDGTPDGGNSFSAIGFQLAFDDDMFGQGLHRYRFLIHCPVAAMEDQVTEWQYFEVSPAANLQPGPLYLRLEGLSSRDFVPVYLPDPTVHPDQPLVAMVYLVGLPQRVAEAAAAECEVIMYWDDVGRQALKAGEPFQP